MLENAIGPLNPAYKLDLVPFWDQKIQFIGRIEGPNCIFKHKYLQVLRMNWFDPYGGRTVAPINIKMQISVIGPPVKSQGPIMGLKIKKCIFFIFSS